MPLEQPITKFTLAMRVGETHCGGQRWNGADSHRGVDPCRPAVYLVVPVEVILSRGMLVLPVTLHATHKAIEGVEPPPCREVPTVAEAQVPPAPGGTTGSF